MDVVSSEARSGLPSELLYADDLVLMTPTMEQLGRRVAEWRASLLVCGKGVRENSVQCTVCKKWIQNAQDLLEDPRWTWLESVEADIEELEINKEDVHNRKKWRRNVMKRKSNPIGKRTINR